jgi:hypothetical protein
VRGESDDGEAGERERRRKIQTTLVTTDKEDSEVRVLTDSEVQTIVNVGQTMEANTDSEVQEVTEHNREQRRNWFHC